MKKNLSRLTALLLTLLLLAGCVPAVSSPAAAETESFTPVPEAQDLPELVLLTPEPEDSSQAPETSETEEPAKATDAPKPTEEPTSTPRPTATPKPTATAVPIDEHGSYTRRDDVALFIHIYGRLPDNFISKTKARKLGWTGGSLEPYAPGKCIGGGVFAHSELLLPEAPGRIYHECDIDTLGKKSRGAKRIVWSNDGLIYYTGDHYESFTLLYGNE